MIDLLIAFGIGFLLGSIFGFFITVLVLAAKGGHLHDDED